MAAASAVAVTFAVPAAAHTTEGGIVLLLPTAYYITGGTIVVALTFLLLLFVPARLFHCLVRWRKRLGNWPALPPLIGSSVSFAILVVLLTAGLIGSRDPLANPLPLAIWTLFWIALTILQALAGDIWAAINPWVAPYRVILRLLGRSADGEPLLRYPGWLGYWPAVLGFLAFGWFELVDPAPADPERLAFAVVVYTDITLVGMILFGERAWLSRAECFSVFLGFVARLSPLQRSGDARMLAFPGTALAGASPLPLGGVLFVLLTLSMVSFDGLDRTFWWLDLGGINPLDFPGRSAVMGQNSLGLLAMWAVLSGAYAAAIWLGQRLAGSVVDAGTAFGAFVLSILPISLGYHFAHYLTTLMVNGQYAILALNDPFALGWNIFGLEGRHVIVSFLADFDSVAVIWKLQAAAVVLGHILALAIAHMIAVERYGATRAAFLSQLPLAVLMVAYTLFGLWLLAAPSAG
ncbi:MAG TPA: hypothetical protein VMT98_17480 [Verrucomicrobiae bacterium]|nr:hypothetical protein [Verrucomicrobiae bacterium]